MSCRNPGRVSSAVRQPPPGVSPPSITRTASPALASIMAAARPFGPEPTTRASPPCLLRRSSRDEQGRPRKETLANLTGLPDESVAALRATLRGRTLVDAEDGFEVARSVPHGDVAAAHVMASTLGLRSLLGPAGRQRDVAYALIISRAVRPESKLSTAGWWAAGDTTLGADLGVAGATTDEIYAAMDWLTARQRQIEKKLAARHLQPGGIAMF